MKLVSMKCSNCGSPLEANAELKQVQCNYCGIKLLIGDEIIKVEHRIVDSSGEKKKNAANVLLYEVKDYKRAKDSFLELSAIYPDDSDIWYSMILAETKNFSFLDISYLSDVYNFFDNYLNVEKNIERKREQSFYYYFYLLNVYKKKYLNNIFLWKMFYDIKCKIDMLSFSEQELLDLEPTYFLYWKKIKNRMIFNVFMLIFSLIFFCINLKLLGWW